MPPRMWAPTPRRRSHAHRDTLTPRGVAAWFGCPTCQHGWPLVLTRETATAISTIITAIAPGVGPTGGTKPLKGGGNP